MTDAMPTPPEPIRSELVEEDASFADIVLEFVEGLSERIRVMDNAVRVGDFEALQMAAHRLKGSGGGFGYPILSERAAELEKRAKAHLLEDCTEALTSLKSVCDRVVVDPS